MKIGDIVTSNGTNRLTLVALNHPTHIGGMYYEVADAERSFYVKSYQLTLVESR